MRAPDTGLASGPRHVIHCSKDTLERSFKCRTRGPRVTSPFNPCTWCKPELLLRHASTYLAEHRVLATLIFSAGWLFSRSQIENISPVRHPRSWLSGIFHLIASWLDRTSHTWIAEPLLFQSAATPVSGVGAGSSWLRSLVISLVLTFSKSVALPFISFLDLSVRASASLN